jgi:predicted Zn finger-like uncharacterized protein
MSVRCPQCASIVPVAEEEIGPAGCMLCCAACGTHWLARRFTDDPFASDEFARANPRAASVEDAVVIDHIAPAFIRRAAEAAAAAPRRWMPFFDARLVKRVSLVVAAFVAALALRAPLVAALPNLPGALPPESDALEFTQVRSQTVELHGDSTLFVEGTIVNKSADDVALPAIRVTLRTAAGAAVKSWLVEPAVAGLAPGRSIGFRSAVASPPVEATQVSLDLTGRQGT